MNPRICAAFVLLACIYYACEAKSAWTGSMKKFSDDIQNDQNGQSDSEEPSERYRLLEKIPMISLSQKKRFANLPIGVQSPSYSQKLRLIRNKQVVEDESPEYTKVRTIFHDTDPEQAGNGREKQNLRKNHQRNSFVEDLSAQFDDSRNRIEKNKN